MKITRCIFTLFTAITFFSCKEKADNKKYLFTTLDAAATGLHFTNKLSPTPDFNMLKYMYYYNGAGVAAGDFNNDGKTDLFFAGNQVQNSLYLNEGNLHFKDVTKDTNIPVDGAWSTGVSVIDINNDGMLDIYVCRVGKFKTLHGKNQLLVCKQIKNGIPVYKDEIDHYGLGFSGFSTQAAFFDYDGDGDLDMFLLNHSVNHDGNYAPRANFINTYDSLAGDQFFKNDNNHFTNVTKTCGINSSKIGYGLGIAISDIDMDGWPDIYVGNDFHENDYLYINQKDGTFKEELNDHIMHTSQFSMGVDVADINNDAYPDIISMDMLPDDPHILKRSLAEDDYQTFKGKLAYGYNNQFSRNNLQLNQRNGMFAEVAFYSGVFATDWSWSSLWMDFDNDGKKDLFISNGIPKRLNDIDYVNYMANDAIQNKLQNNQFEKNDFAEIEKFPTIKLPNRFFKNTGNAVFKDVSIDVKNTPKTFSNGAVYADLDNDGDLDIVVNNIADPALIYENNTLKKKNYADIKLIGDPHNINAVGAKLYAFSEKEINTFEKFNAKGFLSSMEIPIHVGFGDAFIDSILLVWPDNTFQKINRDTANTNWSFKWQQGLPLFNYETIKNFYKPEGKVFKDVTEATQLNYVHEENDFNEFNREILLPKMFGTEGPAIAVADVNGDGLEDVFFGSSKWKISELFLQNKTGNFIKTVQPQFTLDSTYEDVNACFADVNNDHFPDLIITSGGNEFYGQEKWMQPRIYLNDGKGNMNKLNDPFPGVYATQSCIKPFDFNKDGFIDFFVGGRAVPFAYGKIPTSYLLQNDGSGHFKIVTENIAKGLSNIGFVTSAVWVDINRDKKEDLVITLEWGGIEAYVNTTNGFVKKEITSKSGWWNFAYPLDVDGDGDIDFIAGNQGENCRLKPTMDKPVKMYYNDFDNNGTFEQIVTFFQHDKEITMASKMDIEKQLPFIKKKYLFAEDFTNATIPELFTKEMIEHAKVFSADYFSNAILINDGKGNFTVRELPWQAQLSCLKDVAVTDANGDNLPDIITGGNFYTQAMELNRNDANFGTILVNKGNGNFIAENINGVVIKNEIRQITSIKINKRQAWIVVRNNDKAIILQ